MQVSFVRAENYMAHCITRRKLVFYDARGREVRVIHAFPIQRRCLQQFLKEQKWLERRFGLKFKEVRPPRWKIYSLDWEEVQSFVGVWDFNPLFDNGPSFEPSDSPPKLLEFNSAHAAKIEWVFIPCWCGDPWCEENREEQRVVVRYQVVFSPRALVAVDGKNLEEDTSSKMRGPSH